MESEPAQNGEPLPRDPNFTKRPFAYHPADWHLVWLVPALSLFVVLLCVVIIERWPMPNAWITLGVITSLIVAACWGVHRRDDWWRSGRLWLFFFITLGAIVSQLVLLTTWNYDDLLRPPIWRWRTITIEETFSVAARDQRLPHLEKVNESKHPTSLGPVRRVTWRGEWMGLTTWEFLKEPPPSEEAIVKWLQKPREHLEKGDVEKPGGSENLPVGENRPIKLRDFRDDGMRIIETCELIGTSHSVHNRLQIRGRFACATSETGYEGEKQTRAMRYFFDSVRILKDR